MTSGLSRGGGLGAPMDTLMAGTRCLSGRAVRARGDVEYVQSDDLVKTRASSRAKSRSWRVQGRVRRCGTFGTTTKAWDITRLKPGGFVRRGPYELNVMRINRRWASRFDDPRPQLFRHPSAAPDDRARQRPRFQFSASTIWRGAATAQCRGESGRLWAVSNSERWALPNQSYISACTAAMQGFIKAC